MHLILIFLGKTNLFPVFTYDTQAWRLPAYGVNLLGECVSLFPWTSYIFLRLMLHLLFLPFKKLPMFGFFLSLTLIFLYYGDKTYVYPCARHNLLVFYYIYDQQISPWHYFFQYMSRDVLMENYFRDEKANMDTSDDMYGLYFYLHLPIIYDLRVLIPFNSFET